MNFGLTVKSIILSEQIFGQPRWSNSCEAMTGINGNGGGAGLMCEISDRLMDLTYCWHVIWFLSFLTTWTLESLMGDTMKHRAAVVAEGRRQVRENLPFVLLARLGTRNRGPGKPGPSFVVWSCVAEKSRRTMAICRSIPQSGTSSSGKKTLNPISISPFPLKP